MEYGEIYRWSIWNGIFEGPARSFAAWAIDTKTTAPLPEAYDAWRATQGLPPRSEVEREIAESDARIAFIQSHSVKEIADWIRAGSPV